MRPTTPPHYDYEANKHLLVDSTGRRLTVGLFEEWADPTSSAKPIFRLGDWRKVYVEVGDPTDYKAALVLIGSWEHWQLLVDNPRFRAELESWRKEVEVKLRSEAIDHLKRHARDPKGTAAAKWLAEAGFNGEQVKRKPGRPKKDEEPAAEDGSRVRNDAKRLGLVVGGRK